MEGFFSFFPPHLPGRDPATFRSRVRRRSTELLPLAEPVDSYRPVFEDLYTAEPVDSYRPVFEDLYTAEPVW